MQELDVRREGKISSSSRYEKCRTNRQHQGPQEKFQRCFALPTKKLKAEETK